MKKNILYISAFAAALCFGGTALTSCSDPDDIQDLVLDRVLSPTGITARVSQGQNIIVKWNEMTGASSYELEAYVDNNDYDNNTPVIKENITATIDTLKGLIGETDYYIRVRSIDANDETRNSKWVEVMKTTNPEQNMNKVKTGDIQGTAVKVTWKPGIEVDKIICSPSSAGSTAETVSNQLTADDIATGTATITGLVPETPYKITLKLGEKTRGYASVTTNIDFSDAVVISPSDDWVSAIQNASPGSKIALAPGTYDNEGAVLTISSDVKIGAQNSADQPVVKACFKLANKASVLLYQLVLDGTESVKNSFMEYTGGEYGNLTIKGCEVKNYVAKSFIYVNNSVVDEITIDNCLIHHVDTDGGQDFIDSRGGGWNSLSITNSTFYECAPTRDIIRCDKFASGVSASVETFINNCTFYNVCNKNADKRLLYVRAEGNSNIFKNNVVVNFNGKKGFSDQSATGTPTFGNNYYFNCKNLKELAEGNTTVINIFDKKGTVLDANPFLDPDNGDFTITDEELQSYQFGDPRWY